MSGNYKPRTGQDRRKKDIGPPAGWKERRRNPERRMPEVEEISVEEFKRIMLLNGSSTPDLPACEEEKHFDWVGIRKR